MLRSALCLFILALVGVLAVQDRYDGHRVFRITPRTPEQLRLLKTLQDREPELDFWKEPSSLDAYVDVRMAPANENTFRRWMSRHGLTYHVMIDDVQRLLEREQADHSTAENRDFTAYHDYAWIMNWLDQKATACGSRCQTFSIGSSFEGRDLKVFKISTGGQKQAIWIDSGIHAREWISPTTGMYMLERLVDDFGSDPDVDSLLNTYDVYFLPVMNPDGYTFTWTSNRLWRKSRSDHAPSACLGADINRNFDFFWNTVGVSPDPCSETFPGVSAHSESEALAVANFVANLHQNQTVKLFLTLHSYGQLCLLPYGYTTDPAPNHDEMRASGVAFADALTAVHGTIYTVGSASIVLYESSGTSRDWAKGVPNIQYVYTIELRDLGQNGFVLPPDQILPTGQETWAGVKAMIQSFN